MGAALWTKVFLFAGGQAIFLSFVFLFQKERNRPKAYLSAILFFFGITLIYNYIFWTQSFLSYPHFMGINISIYYLFGPLFLLYLDSIRPQPTFQKWAFVHFIPAILLTLYYANYFVLSAQAKIDLANTQTPVPKVDWLSWSSFLGKSYLWFCAHMLVYLAWMTYLYIRDKPHLPNQNPQLQNNAVRQKWSSGIIIFYLIFTVSFITYFPLSTTSFYNISQDFIISGIMTLSIFSIAYMGYRYPKLIAVGAIIKDPPKIKYGDAALPSTVTMSIMASLDRAMQEGKIYRKQGIKVKDLADHLSVQPHVLSQVINNDLGQTFNQYINERRIEDVKSMLREKNKSHEPIIELAYEVGFGNKTSFNSAFKQIVGMSPTEYRKQQQKSYI